MLLHGAMAMVKITSKVLDHIIIIIKAITKASLKAVTKKKSTVVTAGANSGV